MLLGASGGRLIDPKMPVKIEVTATLIEVTRGCRLKLPALGRFCRGGKQPRTRRVHGGWQGRTGLVKQRLDDVSGRTFGVPRVCPDSGSSGTTWGLSIGAGEGIRTLDPDLGKVVLYP